MHPSLPCPALPCSSRFCSPLSSRCCCCWRCCCSICCWLATAAVLPCSWRNNPTTNDHQLSWHHPRRLGDGRSPPLPPALHPDHPHGNRGGEGHQASGRTAVPRKFLRATLHSITSILLYYHIGEFLVARICFLPLANFFAGGV